MAYKIAVDSFNNNETSYKISKYITDRLTKLGIDNFLVENNLPDNEKINVIQKRFGNGNNVIIISNKIGNEDVTSVVYPLRSNSSLASKIANELKDVLDNEVRYYQLRSGTNTALDDFDIIKNSANNQTIVIDYSNLNDSNYEKYAEAVVKALANYANVSYSPEKLEGYYVVKKGDNLWLIASKNNTTVDELKRLNNLSSNTLQIGQTLKLPDSKENLGSEANNQTIYTVKKGDSLWVIANKYGTTVDKIRDENNLSSNLLSIGQKLIIPVENDVQTSNTVLYTVKKGDSLWLIANKYDTTVDKIKDANNLSSNLLSIGQKLTIPSSKNYITYIVKKGDSLWLIANKYDTTVDKIKKLNNISSNTLSIGQALLIP